MPHRAERILVAAVVLLSGLCAPREAAAADQRTSPGQPVQAEADLPWLDQLRTYVRAIAEHQPGSADRSAQLIGSWSERNLDAVRTDLMVLQWICLRGKGRYPLSGGAGSRRESSGTGREQAVALLGLGGLSDDVPAINLTLERAAVLHADIARLVTPVRVDNVGCSSVAPVSVIDGQAVGSGCSNYHWRMGRALLDGLQPDPLADRFAKLWYHATIVFLLEQTDYSDALPQITRARERFPDDAIVQFEQGCYQEALSAPRVQAVVGPMRGTLAPARAQLDAAESSFKRAVKLDPGLAEARIRLGAVLTRLERYREATATLTPALDGVQDPVLRYFGEIFLARAAEGLDDLPAARDHYERARTTFPSSEAPLLALGRLARSVGDRARAAEFVRLAIEARNLADQPADPWWVYDLWQIRNSASLLLELRRSIGPGPGGRQ